MGWTVKVALWPAFRVVAESRPTVKLEPVRTGCFKGLTQELSAVFTVDPEGSIIAAPSKVSFGGFLLG